MVIRGRRFLRSKIVKKLRREVETIPGFDVEELFPRDRGVELVELEGGVEVYLVDGRAHLCRIGGRLVPALPSLLAMPGKLPRVVIDMGAVPHIANGADVMAPGIVKVDEGVKQDDVVVIVDERHGKPIAVGVALMSSEERGSKKKGKVVRNLHHVGDRVWSLSRRL